MGVGGQCHAPAVLPPGMTRYPLYRMLGGAEGQSGRVKKISPATGFQIRNVQPVASRHNDYVIPALTPRMDVQYAMGIVGSSPKHTDHLPPSSAQIKNS
jgi:hypothetical protein